MHTDMRSNPQHLANRMNTCMHPFDRPECEGASLKSDNRSTLDDSDSSQSRPNHRNNT